MPIPPSGSTSGVNGGGSGPPPKKPLRRLSRFVGNWPGQSGAPPSGSGGPMVFVGTRCETLAGGRRLSREVGESVGYYDPVFSGSGGPLWVAPRLVFDSAECIIPAGVVRSGSGGYIGSACCDPDVVLPTELFMQCRLLAGDCHYYDDGLVSLIYGSVFQGQTGWACNTSYQPTSFGLNGRKYGLNCRFDLNNSIFRWVFYLANQSPSSLDPFNNCFAQDCWGGFGMVDSIGAGSIYTAGFRDGTGALIAASCVRPFCISFLLEVISYGNCSAGGIGHICPCPAGRSYYEFKIFEAGADPLCSTIFPSGFSGSFGPSGPSGFIFRRNANRDLAKLAGSGSGKNIFVGACCPGSGSGAPTGTVAIDCPPGHVPISFTGVFAVTSGSCSPNPNGHESTVSFLEDTGYQWNWVGFDNIMGHSIAITYSCVHGSPSSSSFTIEFTDIHEGTGIPIFFYASPAGGSETSPGVWTFHVPGIDIHNGCVVEFNASFSF